MTTDRPRHRSDDLRPGFRGHPVRDRRTRRGHHHQPPAPLQRLPRPHRRGADQGVPAGLGRQGRAGRHPDRRGAEGVLHRRRRQAAGGDRRLRPHRERHVRDRQPAQADPGHPQAGDRRGQRRRGRRRPRAARAVRPDHRVRDRPVRPGRPEGRLVRRRLRVRLPGQGGRREAGPGDLVPVPAVRRGDRRAVGSGERGGAGRPAAGRGQELGRRDRREEPHRAAVPQAVVQRRHRSPGRPVQPRDVRARPVHRLPGGTGGRRRLRREATGRLRLSTSTGTDPTADPTRSRDEKTMEFSLTAEQQTLVDSARPVRPGATGPRVPGAGEGRADRGGGPAGDGGEGFHRARDLQGARRAGRVPADLRHAAGADLHRRLQRRLPAGGRLPGRPDPRPERPARGRRALGPADHQRRGHRRDRPVRTARRLRRGQPPPAGRTGRLERDDWVLTGAKSMSLLGLPTARSSSPAPATKAGVAASPRSWST